MTIEEAKYIITGTEDGWLRYNETNYAKANKLIIIDQLKRSSNEKYTLDLSYKQQRELGFRYDCKLGEYVYEFSVYSYRSMPTLICKLGINEDTNKVWLVVCDTLGRTYPSYYNRTYGTSKVVEIVDRNIKKELRKIGAKEIKEKRNDYSRK